MSDTYHVNLPRTAPEFVKQLEDEVLEDLVNLVAHNAGSKDVARQVLHLAFVIACTTMEDYERTVVGGLPNKPRWYDQETNEIVWDSGARTPCPTWFKHDLGVQR